MVSAPQAIIKIVRNGGTRTPKQIKAQWEYISKDGTVELRRPDSAQGANLERPQWNEASREWAEATGRYATGQQGPSNIDMTTHIVVSFPHGTNFEDAEGAGREWAERMFRPLDQDSVMEDDAAETQNGQHAVPQNYNFITAFHTDREHPHLHVVVNRRGDTNGWLKISRRHPVMNYNNMRQELVDAAANHNIILDATSREERGIMDPAPTDAELRRRARVPIPIVPRDQTDRSINSNSEGNLSYALDSTADFRDFDYSEGGGSSLSSDSDGSDGGGRDGNLNADRTPLSGTRNQGIPTEIIIDGDAADEDDNRKPAAKNRAELDADIQRLQANVPDNSSNDDENQQVDDQDYVDGVAKLPRRVQEARLAEEAKVVAQRARTEQNLADAARWREENGRPLADNAALGAVGARSAVARDQSGVATQITRDDDGADATRKRTRNENDSTQPADLSANGPETSNNAKRHKGPGVRSGTQDMEVGNQSDASDTVAPDRPTREAGRKRGRQDEEDNQSQDTNMAPGQDQQDNQNQNDGNRQEDDAPARQRRRMDVPERTMVLRSDVERERREREEAAMLLRSGKRVGIDRPSDQDNKRAKRDGDHGPQR